MNDPDFQDSKTQGSARLFGGARWIQWIAIVVLIIGLGWGAFLVPGIKWTGRDHSAKSVLPRVPMPADLENHTGLEKRRRAQLAAMNQFKAYVDFSFTDRLPESGITFKHRIVADAGKDYKMVHYDHGNGVCVADVDGDGRPDIYFTNQVGGNELWRNLGGGKFENITESAGVALADRVSVGCAFADITNDGCPDLYVTTVMGGNALLKNDCKGHFTDITAGSGLGYRGHSSGAVFFDFDGDGLLDLFLANVGDYTTNQLVKTTSDGKEYQYFVGRGDAFSGHLYPERSEKSWLFRNLGNGHFEDVTEGMHLDYTGWSGDATIVMNEEGWPDLYVLNMQGNNHYYKNMRGKYFLEQTSALFPKTSWGAMGIKTLDWNNDGRMDIFVTDMHSDMSGDVQPQGEKEKSPMNWPESFLRSGGKSIYGNTFFEKQASGTYEEISDRIGVENFWPWGPSVGDLNADGFQDVFIGSGMGYPFRYGINSVLMNDHGQSFRDAEFILGVEPRKDERTSAPWFELDCSKPTYSVDPNASAVRQEFNNLKFSVRRTVARVFPSLRARFGPLTHPACKDQDGKIEVMGARSTRSAVIFDLDDDGALDIVTNEFNTEPMVMMSNLAKQKGDSLHFLKVRLEGSAGSGEQSKSGSNREGIGARVVMKAGRNIYTQVMDGKSGYLSQSILPLYFGLGDAQKVDAIEVHWPSGRIQVVDAPIRMNSLLVIREPSVDR